MELLSITSLCHIIGVPQNTIENWIEDYNCYIPETNQWDVTYYHLETINVLNFIKRCKDKNYPKSHIMELLAKKDFSIAVEDITDDIQMSINQENYNEHLLSVMQTIGKTVEKITHQDESIKMLLEEQINHSNRLKILEKQMNELNTLRQEINQLQRNFNIEHEYKMKKKSFANLFQG